jgi:hypothetical protein
MSSPKSTWVTQKHLVPTSYTTPTLEWNNLDWHTTNKFPMAHRSWNTCTCKTRYDLWVWQREMFPINSPLQCHYEFPKQHPFRSPQFMGAFLEDHNPHSNIWQNRQWPCLNTWQNRQWPRLNTWQNRQWQGTLRIHYLPFLRCLNSSSHPGHQLLDKNNMNKLCLLRCKV